MPTSTSVSARPMLPRSSKELLRSTTAEWLRPSRTAKGVLYSELVDSGPFGDPKGRTRAQKDGLRYERLVHRELSRIFLRELLYQPCLYFEDSNGSGFARPDFILIPPGRERHRILIDAKRTATWRAEDQLAGLYLPILKNLWADSEFTLVQVAKFSGGLSTVILSLPDVLALPPSDTVHFWHWMA